MLDSVTLLLYNLGTLQNWVCGTDARLIAAALPPAHIKELIIMPAPTPETITLARARYSEGATIATILAEAHMSLGTLYLWLDGGPDDGMGTRLPPLPRRRIVTGKRRRPLRGDRGSLVNRLWRTAERQVRDIEERLRLDIQQPDERERDARVLAIVVKTLRELSALQTVEDVPENDELPSLDDFRRELARKIDGIVAERGATPAGEPEQQGARTVQR